MACLHAATIALQYATAPLGLGGGGAREYWTGRAPAPFPSGNAPMLAKARQECEYFA